MVSLVPARAPRRLALFSALAVAAVAVLGQSPALAKSSHVSRPSYYVVKKAKAKCRTHYTKQTVTLKVRRQRRWMHTQQVRCVYTGSAAGGPGGGGAPGFPENLPTAAVSVTVIPTAVADSYATTANQPLTVGTDTGVLANDDGLGLSAVLVSGSSHGTLTLQRNGAFRYVPNAGYSGIDHFSYRVSDANGESSAPAQVTLDATPIAVAPAGYDVGANATLNVGAPGLLTGAVGSGLQTVLVSPPSGGSVTVNADGSFSYTAAAGFSGADSFSFEVIDADGLGSNVVSATIEVGAAAPTPVAETFSGAVGNTELQVGGSRGGGPEVYQGGASALAGDHDPSGGTLATTPAVITTAQGGSVTLAADGSFTYQPPPGFAGPSDSFNYEVDTSEGRSAQASATINFTGARVWYVKQSAPAGGTGTSAAPFDSLASVGTPGGAAVAGDVIFVFPGSYDGGVTLAANEALVGAPAGLTVSAEDLLDPTGSSPLITNTSSGGTGIGLVSGDSVTGVTVSATSGTGIAVNSANSFTISSSVTVENAGADGIDISGGAGAGDVAATISAAAGHSVDVQSRSGGTLVFSGPISDDGNGLLLDHNTGATIDFSGPITAATANSQTAFEALSGGTVIATSAENTLSSSGIALDVEEMTIGDAGLNFQSINSGSSPSSGPNVGVFVQNSGPGGVTVTGSADVSGSGGTIQGTTGDAVFASNSGALSLKEMLLEPAAGDGVNASAIPSLSVSLSTITGGDTGISANGDASTQQAPQTVTITHNAFSGQQSGAIDVRDAGTTVGFIQDNTIGSESPLLLGASSGDGIDITPSGTGTLTAEVTGNKIDQIAAGDGIDAQAPSGTTLDLTLLDNTVRMDSSSSLDGVDVGATGSVCLNASGNSIAAAGSSAGANALEADQLSVTSSFEIQGYDGGSDAATLLGSGSNNDLTAVGGSPVVAAPDGSNGFTAPSGSGAACPTPLDGSGAI